MADRYLLQTLIDQAIAYGEHGDNDDMIGTRNQILPLLTCLNDTSKRIMKAFDVLQ